MNSNRCEAVGTIEPGAEVVLMIVATVALRKEAVLDAVDCVRTCKHVAVGRIQVVGEAVDVMVPAGFQKRGRRWLCGWRGRGWRCCSEQRSRLAWNLIVPVARVVGIVPACIRLRTECVPGARCTKCRGSGHSMTRRVSGIRRLSSRDGKRRQEGEHDEQEDETERGQRMSEGTASAQGEVRRSGDCIHD